MIISCFSILFTISPSLVKINPSLGLSNLPIGKILVGYFITHYIVGFNLLSVVQTIPTGLLKAKYIFLSFFFYSLAFNFYLIPSLLPISVIAPLIVTFPSLINRSATLLEQYPTSLNIYLFRYHLKKLAFYKLEILANYSQGSW